MTSFKGGWVRGYDTAWALAGDGDGMGLYGFWSEGFESMLLCREVFRPMLEPAFLIGDTISM